MSVVGIDFGNDTCYISVARQVGKLLKLLLIIFLLQLLNILNLTFFSFLLQGGIESIANDYSLRSTPSYVAFGEKSRSMGVAAKSAQNTQAKRTYYGFKRLLGRKAADPRVAEEKARVPFQLGEEGGRVTYPLNYGGKVGRTDASS